MKTPTGTILSVTEVFPETSHAILVFLSKTEDQRFAIWSEIKATKKLFSIPRYFVTAQVARAEFDVLVREMRYIEVEDLK